MYWSTLALEALDNWHRRCPVLALAHGDVAVLVTLAGAGEIVNLFPVIGPAK